MKESTNNYYMWTNFLSGGLSAMIAKTATNPIERVEILRQVQNIDYKGMNLSKSIIKFYKTEGIKGLFRGNLASTLRIFPFSAIEFYSYEFYRSILIRDIPERKNSIYYSIICGMLTGINAITCTYPLDVARTRLAINTQNSDLKEGSLIDVLKKLWKNEGVKGLYKGYLYTFLGAVPFVAIKQTSFFYLKTNFMIPEYKSTLNFIYGSLSGVIGTVALYPTYMMKRVLQANNDKNFSFYRYSKDVLRQQGVLGFYRGLSITLVKVIPYQGILFSCNEKFKVLFKYQMN